MTEDAVLTVEQKRVMQVYAAFGASLLFSLVPSFVAAGLSLALLLGVLIASYALRAGSEESSFTENHMTFIIRTIWITGIVASITMTIASIYLHNTINSMPMAPCMNELMNMVTSMAAPPTSATMLATVEKCWPAYWAANLRVLIIGGTIAIGPVLLYIIVRYVRGLTRANRGYRVSHPKAWF